MIVSVWAEALCTSTQHGCSTCFDPFKVPWARSSEPWPGQADSDLLEEVTVLTESESLTAAAVLSDNTKLAQVSDES